MNSSATTPSAPCETDQGCAAGDLFVTATTRVVVAWLVGLVAICAIGYFADPSILAAALVISGGSLLIALAALCPLAWAARSSKAASPSANSGDLVAPFVLGIMLRLFGTVALFLLCRYQMGRQPEMIAALVAGWYVWLTAVEVVSLAKINPAPTPLSE